MMPLGTVIERASCVSYHTVIHISAPPVPAGPAHHRVHPKSSLGAGGGPGSSWEEEHQESGVSSLPTLGRVNSYTQPSHVGSLDTNPTFILRQISTVL